MSKKITVMLIDDNRIDLFIHNEFINQMKIADTVLEFVNATDALKFLFENEISKWPNFILLDIHMPIMNGFEFLTEIKKVVGFNIPIIVLSTSSHKETISKVTKLGAQGYVAKPNSMREFVRVLTPFLI